MHIAIEHHLQIGALFFSKILLYVLNLLQVARRSKFEKRLGQRFLSRMTVLFGRFRKA